jgi:hypothetical protein
MLVDSNRSSAAKRVGAAYTRRVLLVIGCCGLLGAAMPALAGASRPANASRSPSSARYQAVWCDTTPSSAAVGRQSAPGGAQPDFSASHGRSASRETRLTTGRYQPLKVISDNQWIVSLGIPMKTTGSTVETCVWNPARISSVSSGEASITPADARRLIQLAVALAAAYILFLAAWFWGTRQRRSRVGTAARS